MVVNKLKYWLSICGILYISLGIAQSESVRFVAKATPNKVGTEEKFTLTYTVNARAGNFKVPDNLQANFMVLMGPSYSTQQSIGFGQSETTTSISFVLRPKAEGTFVITPARIEAAGNTIASNPVEVQVVEGTTKQADPNDPEQIARQLSWIKASLSRTSVYVGEPIHARYKLYFKTNVGNPSIVDEPSFRGFLTENVEISQEERSQREFVDNEQVVSSVVKSFLLFPQQPGKYDAQKVNVSIPTSVPTQRRDFFFGNYSVTVDNRTSFSIPAINVKPLPASGRPENFSGGVGSFQFDVKVNRNAVEVDNAVSLQISLRGKGNIKLVDLPVPELPNVFEAYEPKTTQNYKVESSTVSGNKSVEYILIPRYAGTFEIPAMEFSYFDPRSGSYKRLTSDAIRIEVTGESSREAGGGLAQKGSGGRQEQIDILSSDIMFIKTRPTALKRSNETVISQTYYWVILVVLIFMYPLIWLLRNYLFARRLARGTKLRKVEKEALRLLSEAGSNPKTSAGYLYKALEIYFLARLGMGRSEFSRDLFEKRSIEVFGDSFTQQWIGVLQKLEERQYSGGSGDAGMIQEVENIIKKAQQW